MNKQSTHLYEFGSFCLCPDEHLLVCGGKKITLTPKVFQTLLILVKNNGHLVEKNELIKGIWPDTVVEEANLAKHISVLRKVFSENCPRGPFIETVPKHGYRFVAPVSKIKGEITKPGQANSPRSTFIVAAPVLVLAFLVVGYIFITSERSPRRVDGE